MNQNDIDPFLKEQRAHHQTHLVSKPVPFAEEYVTASPTFEQWLAALHLEQRDVLRELWGKLVEYDMNTTLEESAQAFSHDEWANVLGIIEAVKLALGEDVPIRAFT